MTVLLRLGQDSLNLHLLFKDRRSLVALSADEVEDVVEETLIPAIAPVGLALTIGIPFVLASALLLRDGAESLHAATNGKIGDLNDTKKIAGLNATIVSEMVTVSDEMHLLHDLTEA